MPKKDPLADDLNSQVNIPRVKTGLSSQTTRGSIKADWKKVTWTKKNIAIAVVLLGLPYGIAIVATLLAKIYLITIILAGLGLIVLFLYQVNRWLDKDDDF